MFIKAHIIISSFFYFFFCFFCFAVFQKSVSQWLKKADRAKRARKPIRLKSVTVPLDTLGSPVRWVSK